MMHPEGFPHSSVCGKCGGVAFSNEPGAGQSHKPTCPEFGGTQEDESGIDLVQESASVENENAA